MKIIFPIPHLIKTVLTICQGLFCLKYTKCFHFYNCLISVVPIQNGATHLLISGMCFRTLRVYVLIIIPYFFINAGFFIHRRDRERAFCTFFTEVTGKEEKPGATQSPTPWFQGKTLWEQGCLFSLRIRTLVNVNEWFFLEPEASTLAYFFFFLCLFSKCSWKVIKILAYHPNGRVSTAAETPCGLGESQPTPY